MLLGTNECRNRSVNRHKMLTALTLGRLTDIMTMEVTEMNLQTILERKGMTKYRLSKISGVPKTTVIDICSGKSSIEGCTAKTVLMLANALECTMEDLMAIDTVDYHPQTGLPKDEMHYEKGLPEYLRSSIAQMQRSWELLDSGQKDLHWDMNWSELNADINSAEINQEISSEQVWYLREKYLRMGRNDE